MANIVFFDEVAEIKGHRRGLAFDISQAGNYVKRRPSPVNRQTDARMLVRRNLKYVNQYYWDLTVGQRNAWSVHAAAVGVTGPYGQVGHQAGCAMFFALIINTLAAGDPIYGNHPAHAPVTPPTNITLARIDSSTIRTTFTPAAPWGQKRIYLRQALPGPGVRNWKPADGYIAEYSALNPNSPHDFTTHFSFLNGWHGRFWMGTQRSCGCRSAETLFDL